jgi:hypothetical protein
MLDERKSGEGKGSFVWIENRRRSVLGRIRSDEQRMELLTGSEGCLGWAIRVGWECLRLLRQSLEEPGEELPVEEG